MNKSIRNLCAAVATILPAAAMSQGSAKDAYLQAYSDHMMKNIPLVSQALIADGMAPEEAEGNARTFMQHAVDCHARTLDLYPEELRQAMFKAVENGGSYPDAESALKIAVGEAQFGGKQELIQGFVNASEQMAACLEGDGA